MDRCAVFVDAGYLFAQGSKLVCDIRHGRDSLHMDVPALRTALIEAVEQLSGLPLLRIYWYDAAKHGKMTDEHTALAHADDIKIRLGRMNQYDQQKGVDTLMVTDLGDLARNRAMADAILISGDEDIRIGVLVAQQFGVRVHLLGVAPTAITQSPSLIREADTCLEWDKDTIERFLSVRPDQAAANALITSAEMGHVVAAWLTSLDPEDRGTLRDLAPRAPIPRELDAGMLAFACRALSVSELTDPQRHEARRLTRELVPDMADATP